MAVADFVALGRASRAGPYPRGLSKIKDLQPYNEGMLQGFRLSHVRRLGDDHVVRDLITEGEFAPPVDPPILFDSMLVSQAKGSAGRFALDLLRSQNGEVDGGMAPLLHLIGLLVQETRCGRRLHGGLEGRNRSSPRETLPSPSTPAAFIAPRPVKIKVLDAPTCDRSTTSAVSMPASSALQCRPKGPVSRSLHGHCCTEPPELSRPFHLYRWW